MPRVRLPVLRLKQAIIVVPEKTIGASFKDEPLTKFGFWAVSASVPAEVDHTSAGGPTEGRMQLATAFRQAKPRGGHPRPGRGKPGLSCGQTEGGASPAP